MSNLYSKDRRALRQSFYAHRLWPRIRKIQLDKEPLCQICSKNGKQSVAEVCDHIDPTWETFQDFIKGPFQSLCKPCHADKTACDDIPKMIKKERLKERFF